MTRKTVIATGAAVAAVLAATSLPASAGSLFSAKGEFGVMQGPIAGFEYAYIEVRAYSDATKTKTFKANTAGAYAYGSYSWCDATYCYYRDGWGEATGISFDANGNIPKTVTASGSIPFTWYGYRCDYDYNCYYDEEPIEDVISFDIHVKKEERVG